MAHGRNDNKNIVSKGKIHKNYDVFEKRFVSDFLSEKLPKLAKKYSIDKSTSHNQESVEKFLKDSVDIYNQFLNKNIDLLEGDNLSDIKESNEVKNKSTNTFFGYLKDNYGIQDELIEQARKDFGNMQIASAIHNEMNSSELDGNKVYDADINKNHEVYVDLFKEIHDLKKKLRQEPRIDMDERREVIKELQEKSKPLQEMSKEERENLAKDKDLKDAIKSKYKLKIRLNNSIEDTLDLVKSSKGWRSYDEVREEESRASGEGELKDLDARYREYKDALDLGNSKKLKDTLKKVNDLKSKQQTQQNSDAVDLNAEFKGFLEEKIHDLASLEINSKSSRKKAEKVARKIDAEIDDKIEEIEKIQGSEVPVLENAELLQYVKGSLERFIPERRKGFRDVKIHKAPEKEAPEQEAPEKEAPLEKTKDLEAEFKDFLNGSNERLGAYSKKFTKNNLEKAKAESESIELQFNQKINQIKNQLGKEEFYEIMRSNSQLVFDLYQNIDEIRDLSGRRDRALNAQEAQDQGPLPRPKVDVEKGDFMRAMQAAKEAGRAKKAQAKFERQARNQGPLPEVPQQGMSTLEQEGKYQGPLPKVPDKKSQYDTIPAEYRKNDGLPKKDSPPKKNQDEIQSENSAQDTVGSEKPDAISEELKKQALEQKILKNSIDERDANLSIFAKAVGVIIKRFGLPFETKGSKLAVDKEVYLKNNTNAIMKRNRKLTLNAAMNWQKGSRQKSQDIDKMSEQEQQKMYDELMNIGQGSKVRATGGKVYGDAQITQPWSEEGAYKHQLKQVQNEQKFIEKQAEKFTKEGDNLSALNKLLGGLNKLTGSPFETKLQNYENNLAWLKEMKKDNSRSLKALERKNPVSTENNKTKAKFTDQLSRERNNSQKSQRNSGPPLGG